jgi:[ribosomal protein S5]-alanine N-acetyltransferase
MEKMPYQERLEQAQLQQAQLSAFDWHCGLPTLTAERVTLREIRESDAPALLAMLTTDEVAEFVSPLPRTVDGFTRFIREVQQERRAGNSFCFAIVPDGYEDAMGLFQVRQLEPGFGTAEWGFALGSPFWGSGAFQHGARAVVDFAFGVVGVHRLEARSIAANGRGNGALRKMGALQEGLLRRAFLRNGRYYDQILWSILKDDWRRAKAVWGPKLH